MKIRFTGVAALAAIVLLIGRQWSYADEIAATQPANQVKTGELDLTFTERSPLSTRQELAQRLSLKETDMGDDYDLSQRPFKAYVPRNYDSTVPCGVIVYLGYKDTVSTPPLWQPMLDQSHLIFISPVCHSGPNYAPAVPGWQTMGLALDAVYNLKKQYNIDARRIYQMSWNRGATPMAIATSDVFTGFIVAFDQGWWQAIRASNGGFYPSNFPEPVGSLYEQAKEHPFFLIDDQSEELAKEISLKAGAMRRADFDHVTQVGLSAGDDLHFPNLKTEWFSQQALPFLDKFSVAAPKPATRPQTAAGLPPTSEAQSLLSQAQLLIANNQPDLARAKLQSIIDQYPDDPAAGKAKELLEQLGNQ